MAAIVKSGMKHSIVEAHTDWLTLTRKPSSAAPSLNGLATRFVNYEHNEGAKQHNWHWREYVGVRCGAATFGRSPQGELLQLSGGLADLAWEQADLSPYNVTRLDLAVTCRVPQPPDVVVRRAYEEACAFRSPAGADPNATLIQQKHGGYTTYVGTRGGEFFGRVYNKGAESLDKRYSACVRWETEYRADLAPVVRGRLNLAPDRTGIILGIVRTDFYRRGVVCPWTGRELSVRVERPPRHPHAAARLAWLDQQVRPAVEDLCDQGHMAEVLAVLFGGHPDLWQDARQAIDGGGLGDVGS